MALRVAFDVDGVLADLDRALLELAWRMFGPDLVAEGGGAGRLRLAPGQRGLVWDAARETVDFWTSLDECEPGIVSRVAAFALAQGWDVLFVTRRPGSAGAPVEDQTRRWLEAHGFSEPRVIVEAGARGPVIRDEAVAVTIDDWPGNCASIVSESEARVFLVWRDGWGHLPDGALPAGVTLVHTVDEFLGQLAAEAGR